MTRRVVVTGIGLVSPVGNNVQDSWQNILAGKTGVRLVSRFDASALPTRIGAEVKGFQIGDAMELKEANRAPLFLQYAAKASQEAIMMSGFTDKVDPNRVGTCIGVGIGALDLIESMHDTLREKGPRRITPFFIPYMIANMASGLVSRQFDLRGPNMCPTTACTSGTHGVGEAWLYIKSGMADAMVCGGAESAMTPLSFAGFNAAKALSQNNDHPEKASRPFDLNRDGFVMGEGAGVLVLEEYESAKKRGAVILAEVTGYGMSGDAHHITAPAPDHEGAQRCMKAAMSSANLTPKDIHYVNAHGTSTEMNDAYETLALKHVFGDHIRKVNVSSTKGVTGHCLGAAGGIEAVISVLAIRDQIAPPTAGLENPDPACDLDYTPLTAKKRSIDHVLSNSFGFGGTNGTLAFSRFGV
jgi:3-oxoacyl-[acyl-carrier-protein] synthase II